MAAQRLRGLGSLSFKQFSKESNVAKYRVTSQNFYSKGVLWVEGEEFVIPDGYKPHRSFVPLDAGAKAAFAKHYPDSKGAKADVAPAPVPEEPKTMSEVNKKRPSDKSPL